MLKLILMEIGVRRIIVALWVVMGLAGCNSQGVTPVPRVQQEQPTAAAESRRSEGQSSRRGNRAEQDTAAGAFDFYLLTLSWSPEFCATHPDKAECAAHPGFVLHGLWPQNFAGTYPEDCSNAPGPGNPGQYKDIYPDAGLLAHEWKTHGTCSGLGPDAFFGDARKALHEVVVPRELAAVSAPEQLTPDQVLGAFAKANPGFARESFAMSCGNNRLTAVEVCLGKDLKAVACQGVRSCRANVVKVTPQ